MSAYHVGGSGEPLLLLHGMTSSWRAWKPLLPMLEEHHEVWAVTMPGHLDGPPMPDGEFSVDLLVDGLTEQLDAIGVPERPHVVGNSLGGWAALELARRGRARSVVALSPAGPGRCPRTCTGCSRRSGSGRCSPAGHRCARWPRAG
nr:alpha/beta fold hydrolase [Pseudonocardia sp. AL041005-10]